MLSNVKAPSWHNPTNRLLTGSDVVSLVSLPTKPTGTRLEGYRKAFVHSSYCGKDPGSYPPAIVPLQVESNERLEFLGDAVIDVVVAEYLYKRYPGEDEGFLTQMRSNLVNGRMLAKLGRTIDVQRFLLLSKEKEHLRESDSVIEDVFEALVGAKFVDRGVPAVREFLVALIEKNLDFAKLMNFSEKDMFVRYYKEKHGCELSLVASKTPDNNFKVRVYEKQKGAQVSEGHGRSRREAMDDASRRGLRGNGFRF